MYWRGRFFQWVLPEFRQLGRLVEDSLPSHGRARPSLAHQLTWQLGHGWAMWAMSSTLGLRQDYLIVCLSSCTCVGIPLEPITVQGDGGLCAVMVKMLGRSLWVRAAPNPVIHNWVAKACLCRVEYKSLLGALAPFLKE